MIWDEENRLACSHENVQNQTLPQTPASCDNAGGTPNDARYYYDDQGNRVVKDGATFHMYPNQNYSTDGNKQYKHVYIGETKLLTKFVEPTNRIEDRQYYAHGDHLGSTGFVTDSRRRPVRAPAVLRPAARPGSANTRRNRCRSSSPARNSTRRPTCTTTARATTTRVRQVWQTPDPIFASYLDGSPNNGVYTSGNLNPYLYAYGNPQGYIDPSGKLALVDDILFWGIGRLFGARTDSFLEGVGQNFVESWSVIGRTVLPFHGGSDWKHLPAWLVQNTWGLVNEVIANIIAYGAVEIFGGKTEMYEYVQTITTEKDPGFAFSIGSKVIGGPSLWTTSTHRGVDTVRHEQGHYFQNLLLGPLFLPVIAVPSMLHMAAGTTRATYEDFYTEGWASAWVGNPPDRRWPVRPAVAREVDRPTRPRAGRSLRLRGPPPGRTGPGSDR